MTNKSCSTFKINLAAFKDAWALHTMVSLGTITFVTTKIYNANSCFATISWKTIYAFLATRFATNTRDPISTMTCHLFFCWPLHTFLPFFTIFFRKTTLWPTKTINTFQRRRTFLAFWWLCPCLNYTIFRWLLCTTARPNNIKTLAPTTYLVFRAIRVVNTIVSLTTKMFEAFGRSIITFCFLIAFIGFTLILKLSRYSGCSNS